MKSIDVSRVGLVAAALAAWGCVDMHRAHVVPLPPSPVTDVVADTGRLWVELDPMTPDTQCIEHAGRRPMCFEQVHDAIEVSLRRALSKRFDDIRVRRRGDAIAPHELVLQVQVALDTVDPTRKGPGWAALLEGDWQLMRNGRSLLREHVRSQSDPTFAYGSSLGPAAAQVVAAVTRRVATELGQFPGASQPSWQLPKVAVSEFGGLRRGQRRGLTYRAALRSHGPTREPVPVRAPGGVSTTVK